MADGKGIPFLEGIVRQVGAIPAVLISIGFFFVGVGGLAGDLSLSNKKLMFGFLLVSLGQTWPHYHDKKIYRCHRLKREYCADHEYDERRHLHIDARPLAVQLFSTVVFLLLLLAFLWQRLPCPCA